MDRFVTEERLVSAITKYGNPGHWKFLESKFLFVKTSCFYQILKVPDNSHLGQ